MIPLYVSRYSECKHPAGLACSLTPPTPVWTPAAAARRSRETARGRGIRGWWVGHEARGRLRAGVGDGGALQQVQGLVQVQVECPVVEGDPALAEGVDEGGEVTDP